MFVVLLRFAANRSEAPQAIEGHNAWIKKGFEDGVFLMTGSLQPKLGGGVLAHNTSLAALQDRVNADPFVARGIVSADIFEITPGKTDARLAFLAG
jgi:uncharacterized protein YciI